MAVYILKHFYAASPASGPGWNLVREVAFEALSDQEAVAMAQKQGRADIGPLGGLAIVTGPDGQRIWECEIPPGV